MISKIRNSKLFKNTFIYTILQFVNKGIPFLLLPVLTFYLTPEDFGKIALFSSFIGIAGVFVGISIGGAVGVNYFKYDEKELSRYVGNAIFSLLLNTFIVLSIVYITLKIIEPNIVLSNNWLFIAVLVSLLQHFTYINLTIWRSRQEAKPYAIYEISEMGTNISLSLFLIIILHLSWEGRVLGLVIAASIFGIISLIVLKFRKYLTLKFDKKHIKDIYSFGLPLIPHQLAIWGRSGVDIIFITSFLGASSAGLYSLGFQLGSILGILLAAFNNAYSPYLYEKLKNHNDDIKINLVNFTYIYFFIILFLSFFISFCVDMVLPYMVDDKFLDSIQYVYLISLSFVFQGMYYMMVNYIFFTKKNMIVSYITLTTSILHVVISYFSIQNFGAIGAAYTTIFTYLITFLLTWYFSNKCINMPWFCGINR